MNTFHLFCKEKTELNMKNHDGKQEMCMACGPSGKDGQFLLD